MQGDDVMICFPFSLEHSLFTHYLEKPKNSFESPPKVKRMVNTLACRVAIQKIDRTIPINVVI